MSRLAELHSFIPQRFVLPERARWASFLSCKAAQCVYIYRQPPQGGCRVRELWRVPRATVGLTSHCSPGAMPETPLALKLLNDESRRRILGSGAGRKPGATLDLPLVSGIEWQVPWETDSTPRVRSKCRKFIKAGFWDRHLERRGGEEKSKPCCPNKGSSLPPQEALRLRESQTEGRKLDIIPQQ